MKKTTTEITCDRCKLMMDKDHWARSFSVRKDAVFWEANSMLEGDYCVSCSIVFEALMQKAFLEWKKGDH